MLIYAAAAVVPMHVVTRPPLEPAAEEKVMAEVTELEKLIEQHKQESDVVIERMRRLNDGDVGDYERKTIKRRLSHEFHSILLQLGVPEGVAFRVASMCARHTVSGIHPEGTRRAESIVRYFRCDSVRALYELDEMITSGFMCAAFTEIIHSLTSSTPTVYVYVKPDDFDFVLSSLNSLQDTGLFWELK